MAMPLFRRNLNLKRILQSFAAPRPVHSKSTIHTQNASESDLCNEKGNCGAAQLSTDTNSLEGTKIELMESDLFWAPAFSELSKNPSGSFALSDNEGGGVQLEKVMEDHDIDQLEDMRDRGHLFYKLDDDSRESEELNFNFRRKKLRKSVQDNKKRAESNIESSKNKNKLLDCRQELSDEENFDVQKVSENVPTDFWSCEEAALERKKKLMSFKEITDVYMHPFCLDIFVSKSSVCACIVHRVTSKVVVVAQSISKDMKRELVSTKDLTACAAVGGLLAQRAIADDIYTAIYTPRKGEKIEGKRMVVLQSLIDHGVDIKVRLKQRRPRNSTYMGAGAMVDNSGLSF